MVDNSTPGGFTRGFTTVNRGALTVAIASFRVLLASFIGLAWSSPVAAAGAAAQQVTYGPAAQQTADLYPGPDGAPVLVWITGGGWVLDGSLPRDRSHRAWRTAA